MKLHTPVPPGESLEFEDGSVVRNAGSDVMWVTTSLVDIVERLRSVCMHADDGGWILPEECEEAAQEILRLRAELAAERAKNEGSFW